MTTAEKMIDFLSANNCSVYNQCDKDISECKWSSSDGCLHPDHPLNGRSKIVKEMKT